MKPRASFNDRLSAMIESIYDAGVEPRHWPQVLSGLAGLFGAPYGGIILSSPTSEFELINTLGWDPSFKISYKSYYGRLDPVMPHVVAAPPGTTLTEKMVVPRTEYEQSEFYHDWIRPQGFYSALAANIVRQGGRIGVAILSRGRQSEDFQQRDLDLLAIITPHFRRAIRMHLHLASARAERDTLTGALHLLTHGALVVDASCRVLFANQAAEEIFAKADGLGVGPAGLHAAATTQTSKLQLLVAIAAAADGAFRRSSSLLIERPSMKRAFQVLISPLRAGSDGEGAYPSSSAVMLVIIDPERESADPEQHLVRLYNLTPAEARVAREVGRGENLPAVAEKLGVLPSTVRTHLHRVFAKTATNRQSELVRLVEAIGLMKISSTSGRPPTGFAEHPASGGRQRQH